jgi:hypothetical protein
MADSTFTGVFMPLIVIGVMQLLSRKEAPGWGVIQDLAAREAAREHPSSSSFPALIVSVSLAVCGLTLLALIPLNDTDRGMLAGFSIALFVMSAGLYALSCRMKREERS